MRQVPTTKGVMSLHGQVGIRMRHLSCNSASKQAERVCGACTAERQRVRGAQAQAEENLAKQREVLDVIGKSQAAYKHVFGFAEWRSACEARPPRPPGSCRAPLLLRARQLA